MKSRTKTLILEALKTSLARKRGLAKPEIERLCGLSKTCIHNNMHKLHADRTIYISGWVTDVGGPKGASYFPRYKRGNKDDAPKPPPMTKAEQDRRYRERAIASGLMEDLRAAKRADWWKRRPPRRDPLAAALFGASA